MAIKRRPTEARNLVCRRDPAIEQLGFTCVKDYCQTLDIKSLGDYLTSEKVEEPISVFNALPLQVKYEQYVGVDTNHWFIFRSHVKNITHLEFELKFKEGLLEEEHRADFSPEVVVDIADQIISLASRGNSSVFFSPPAGYADYMKNCLLHRVAKAEADVNSTAAKVKDLNMTKSQKTTE